MDTPPFNDRSEIADDPWKTWFLEQLQKLHCSRPFHVFAGETPESESWANLVSHHLQGGVVDSPRKIVRFRDGESQVQLQTSVTNKVCVVVSCLHSTQEFNCNDNMLVLFQMCYAMATSHAKEIIILSPYMPMSRQDKPDDNRSSVGAGLLPILLKTACINTPVRFITFDLHSAQICTAFQSAGVLIDNLHSEPHLISFCANVLFPQKSLTPGSVVVMAPDNGAGKRAKRMSSQIGCGYGIMDKTRDGTREVSDVKVIGVVEGKDVLLVDDMCDSGGTICRAAEELMKRGARSITILVCHGVFSCNAIEKLSANKYIESVVFTSSCVRKSYQINGERRRVAGKFDNVVYYQLTDYPGMFMIDTSWLAAEAIRRRIGFESVSELFDLKATSQKHLEHLQMLKKIENKSKKPAVSLSTSITY